MSPMVIVICCLLVLFGCLKRPGPSLRYDEADLPRPETLYREILSRCEQVRTLRGTAHLRLQTEQEKVSLDAVIVCERGGRLRVEVLDWLNHLVFLALFDEEGFLAYSVPDNEYLEGPDDPVRIQEILGIPLSAKELAALALGDPFFLPMADPVPCVRMDQNALLLEVEPSSPGPRYLVWLGERTRPERMLIVQPQRGRGNPGGFQVDYGRYRKIGSVLFPHRIRVAAVGSKRVLQLDYQQVLLNESLEENLFRFVLPEGAGPSTK